MPECSVAARVSSRNCRSRAGSSPTDPMRYPRTASERKGLRGMVEHDAYKTVASLGQALPQASRIETERACHGLLGGKIAVGIVHTVNMCGRVAGNRRQATLYG